MRPVARGPTPLWHQVLAGRTPVDHDFLASGILALMVRSGGRRVTIIDLARELGLSKSAVSNALNGAGGVSAATRSRVQLAAQRHGWRPNVTARALSSGRAHAIGVCLAREASTLSESYYSGVLVGLESVLEETDYGLLIRISHHGEGGDLDVYRRWHAEGRVDAVILFDVSPDDPRVHLLDEIGLPHVLTGDLPATTQSVVGFEITREAELIADHLAQQGCRNVVHLAGPPRMHHERDRERCLRAALDQRGMTGRWIWDTYGEQGGTRAAEQVLSEGWAEAVVCSQDLTVVGVMAALQTPTALPWSLVSWDDSMLCRVMRPGVTAVRRDPAQLGAVASQTVLEALAGASPQRIVLDAELVVRESTAAAVAGLSR